VHTPQGTRVECQCGQAFLAPPSLWGQVVNCPACGGTIAVPGLETATWSASAAAPPPPAVLDPLIQQPVAPAQVEDDKWIKIVTRVAIGAVALLILAIVINSLISWIRTPRPQQQPPVADVPRPKPSAPQPKPTKSTGPVPGPPPPPPPSGSQPAAATLPAPFVVDSSPTPEIGPALPASPSTTGFGKSTAGGGAGLERLPEGVVSWHEQPGAKLSGVRRVGASETETAHFSWMTGLLPFIGQGKVYEKIDFTQPLTKESNIQVGGVSIPEFLNPLDDYIRWKGYPFDGIALTHFAGMSGIEDTRNVVAAKLPRTDPRAGVFGYDEVARPDQITDGTSQTVMVVGAGALANPWIFGGGATIRGAREPLFDKTSGLGTKGLPGGGTIAVMADGSVRHFTADVDPKVFRAMCTIHGAETVDVNNTGKPFALDSLKGTDTNGSSFGKRRPLIP
jgi:hypothetical protein